MCSVIDSSMPVHSKAGGNFLVFGDSEGGDTKRLGGSQYFFPANLQPRQRIAVVLALVNVGGKRR